MAFLLFSVRFDRLLTWATLFILQFLFYCLSQRRLESSFFIHPLQPSLLWCYSHNCNLASGCDQSNSLSTILHYFSQWSVYVRSLQQLLTTVVMFPFYLDDLSQALVEENSYCSIISRVHFLRVASIHLYLHNKLVSYIATASFSLRCYGTPNRPQFDERVSCFG